MTTKQIADETILRRTFLGSLIASCACFVGWGHPRAIRPSKAPGGYHHSTGLVTEDVFNKWHSRSRMPIWSSHLPELSLLIEAIRRNEPLYGPYTRWGQHDIRRITPLHLFHLEPEIPDSDPDLPVWAYPDVINLGPAYLQAWDHDRQAPRTFLAEYFKPRYTAPWMQAHVKESNPDNWQSILNPSLTPEKLSICNTTTFDI
jgi:hypothetical protein